MTTTPPYTTEVLVRDLVSRHSQQYAATAGSVDNSILLTAISSAQQVIDSRLGRLFTVPFDPVPELIRDLATTLAAIDIDMTFREVRDYSSELNPLLLRKKDAMQLLKDLAAGEAIIPGYEPPDDGGPEDNPNDPGSIVGVFNPTLVGVCNHCGGVPCYQTPACWGQF